ncbi:MAG TPA: IPT/TIG domain-containing protein, partial [Terriglobia bacterium]|nr:IPT/TIG domain-containing protein [Terriglobia bacterium]
MIRGLHREAYILEIGLSLLLAAAMVGCGGGGGGATVTTQDNNPVPAVTTISPTSATSGAAKQTLTINGTNFLSSSTVTYNSVAHAPTFVNSTQLTISLSASDQATAGNYAVVVTNPSPGGGDSNTVNFTVNNPVPSISSISPASVMSGAAAQALTINGTNFLSTSTVTYNSVAHAATFVNSTQLMISLSASDQATAGSYAVVLTNPTPGGGASNSMNLTVDNPVPALSSLSPASATAGAAAQTLTIDGTNFLSSSTVTYNAVPHTPTFVSSTKLTIPLSANDQATAGNYAVVVTNPGPDGGASNSVNFVVNAGGSVEVTLNGSSSGTASETVG